ncbi:DUF6807 family protein [Streptomyces sp. NPDC060028]|uniref:DUF6807 family protein n=1 Tax=Streptomyces sp. NPDC060028 TaxID=3347041 RepID=UPI0036D13905
MTFELLENENSLTVRARGVDLFRYVHRPVMDPFEAPKPYLHPVRTLADDVVTGHRPHDHRWHKGIQITASWVSGQNFWGGGTYLHGQGYVDLPNRDADLMFGSPGTQGRKLAGYSGLFRRGPRDFTGGDVLGPAMGEQGDWVAFIGTHDEVDRSSTLLSRHVAEHPW